MLSSSIPRLAEIPLCEYTDTPRNSDPSDKTHEDQALARCCLKRLAAPQARIALLAVTSFHVQIITRIATAYPLLYMWMASNFIEARRVKLFGKTHDVSKGLVRWMVMYGVIQGGLFATFLPPA